MDSIPLSAWLTLLLCPGAILLGLIITYRVDRARERKPEAKAAKPLASFSQYGDGDD